MQNNWEKELGRALKESVGEPDAERMAMTAEALHKAYRENTGSESVLQVFCCGRSGLTAGKYG